MKELAVKYISALGKSSLANHIRVIILGKLLLWIINIMYKESIVIISINNCICRNEKAKCELNFTLLLVNVIPKWESK